MTTTSIYSFFNVSTIRKDIKCNEKGHKNEFFYMYENLKITNERQVFSCKIKNSCQKPNMNKKMLYCKNDIIKQLFTC